MPRLVRLDAPGVPVLHGELRCKNRLSILKGCNQAGHVRNERPPNFTPDKSVELTGINRVLFNFMQSNPAASYGRAALPPFFYMALL
jgi:hypothetical protein